MKKNILFNTDQWKEYWLKKNLTSTDINDPIIKEIFRYIPFNPKGSVIEIGCYPGRYLEPFGEKGYELNGIDLMENIGELYSIFKGKDFLVGSFEQEDFEKKKFDKKYDVVCSFGFIEHFTNWEEILLKHANLVKLNGYLVITTPNFSGKIQKLLHKYFDTENYNRHVIGSMNPDLWKNLISPFGFVTEFSGCFGGFNFWVEPQHRNIIKKIFLWFTIQLTRVLKKLITYNHNIYSPYYGIIAKRIK